MNEIFKEFLNRYAVLSFWIFFGVMYVIKEYKCANYVVDILYFIKNACK